MLEERGVEAVRQAPEEQQARYAVPGEEAGSRLKPGSARVKGRLTTPSSKHEPPTPLHYYGVAERRLEYLRMLGVYGEDLLRVYFSDHLPQLVA